MKDRTRRGVRQRGVTLIELAIGMAIAAVLMTLALPNFTIFLHNARIKNVAETTLSGLTLARTEAVRHNRTTSLSLVTDLTAACALDKTALNWVVSAQNPAGLCDVAASDTVAPMTIQKKSGMEGSGTKTDGSSIVEVATDASSNANAFVSFNALGRVTTVAGTNISQFDFSNPTGGTCEHIDAVNGTMRCLRILVTSGGAIKMCDPKVTSATDSRKC